MSKQSVGAAHSVRARKHTSRLLAVFARSDGRILDLPGVTAAADIGSIQPADPEDFIPMPEGTLLLMLPGRSAGGFRSGTKVWVDQFEGGDASAVAAALPLGFTRVALPACEARHSAPRLPLYGYTAVAWHEDRFRVAAVRTDELESWSPQAHGVEAVRESIGLRTLEFPSNSLLGQLARCATEYGCYTAQNLFLRQGEAALPVSPACNARCLGCISEQDPDDRVRSAQERVRTTPTVAEITELAVAHLRAAPSGLVSFGQGCEGEPLLAAPLIAQAIKRIRQSTSAGLIHCNTNASHPSALQQLIDAGLQSIRVSLNSARPQTYAAYYRPRGYGFAQVLESLQLAAARGITISLNLLTHPGVTDDPVEMDAFAAILRAVPISMVQTRTLNVDPAWYFSAVGRPSEKAYGMRRWMRWLAKEFPAVRIGNFTRGFG